MLLASDIRSNFLHFFERNEHRIIESSPVVPHNDPSLLFTNAGMVQFKNVFTGLETREYKRATTSQKCVRAGGKHNDLDQVGYTARHHTFFEMLGNFSFGDYFKADAINFAWTLLTKELGLPKEKLSVTVFHTDDEAKEIWRKVAGEGVLIIPISTSDNFWSMGDTGPCGPCTEIFYDHGPDIPGGLPGTPDESGDRYTEIWNLVFMQFEQRKGGDRVPLAKKSIDTGMGLERITSVLQGVHDNYQTDLFRPIIQGIREVSKTNFEDIYPSYKVIADHLRSISFLIADGVVPSNEGQGYVLRRIMRRAIRHGHLLSIKRPFLYELSGIVINLMKDAYPELEKARETISAIILNEEEKFLDTLERGLSILNKRIQNVAEGSVLDGEIAFKLYDTYGFPLDLTQDILRSKNITVDTAAFDAALDEQRNRAKWAGSGASKEAKVWHQLKEKLPATKFVGYDNDCCNSKVLAIVKGDEEVSEIDIDVEKSQSEEPLYIVTAKTPFYAECGGQCGDTGVLEIINQNGSGCADSGSGAKFLVSDTQKFCDAIIAHKIEAVSPCSSSCSKISVGDAVSLHIDADRRRKIRANHTATHLLQAALRMVLGNHIAQRGSSLNDERLRFDFAHNAALSKAEIEKVEDIVNSWILEGFRVANESMSKNDAVAAGAMALFGEKYGDVVRTVKVCREKEGESRESDGSPDNGAERAKEDSVSFELCGGTHIPNTALIGSFKITSEASIGSGIRRVEAITGAKVLERMKDVENTLEEASDKLKCTPSEISQKVEDILGDLKKAEKVLAAYRQNTAVEKLAVQTLGDDSGEEVSVGTLVADSYSIDELRGIADSIGKKYPKKAVILLISPQNDSEKVNAVVSVSRDLQNKYHAGKLLKSCIEILDGKGGGNAAFAQGAGKDRSKVNEAVETFVRGI